MADFLVFLSNINRFLWNGPLLFLLLGTHIFLTIYTKCVQKNLTTAIKLSVVPDSSETSAISGGMSRFSTLATTLAATLGTGNIIGISTAVALGGPGAVFWCWITGIFGMATTYSECFLSLRFRSKQSGHKICGGPMYLLKNTLNRPRLAVLYAFFLLATAFCMGCSTQSQAITEALYDVFALPTLPVGILLTLLLLFALLGTNIAISRFCTFLVPFMAIFYLFGCVFLLFTHITYIPAALRTIISDAFSLASLSGGFLGSTFLLSARYGIARGLFTNEAGLGSAAVTAASAHSDSRSQALVMMSATFWDTVVMCGVTGLVIVCAGLAQPTLYTGCSIGNFTLAAFSLLPFAGRECLAVSVVLFAVATLLGWSYLGEKAVEFLFGNDQTKTYRLLYCCMIFLGSQMPLTLVWELSDFFNACMVPLNLYAIYRLRKHLKE